MLPLAARCIVEIGGTRYDSVREGSLLQSVTVDLTTDKTSEAVIVFADSDFSFTDRHLDESGLPNLQARVWMGYRELGEPWFKGTLAGHEHDGEYATFRFHDQGAKMKRETKVRYHNRKTDIEIMRELAAEHGLQLSLGDGVEDSEQHDSLIQRGVSDWDFIRTIARRSGVRVWVEGDTLFVRSAGKDGQSAATITYREDFLLVRPVSLSYTLPESRRGRHRSVAVHGRGAAGKRLTGEAQEDGRGRVHQGAGEDLTHHTKAAADRRARARRAHVRESAFEHRIRLIPATVAGRIGLRYVLKLAGCGDFYGGEYTVHSLRKEWRTGKLVDELTLRRDLGKQKTRPRRTRARAR